MKTRLAFACLLFATPAAAGEPSDLVARFYSGELSLFEEAVADAHTGGSLQAFLGEVFDHEAKRDDMMCLDFDPVIDAQDFDEAELASTLVLNEEVNSDGAIVDAGFSLFGEPRSVVWTLRRIGGEWRVTDIASDESGWRISDMACEAPE
ncbi:MAG: DUF3828 domain-containing protein [Brucellaceae bacterium]|nr:DUF3828 domain-containing protein [Brucellaceae bacterium]